MWSLRHLRSQYPEILLIDAASSLTQVILLSRGGIHARFNSPDEAGVAVFKGVEDALIKSGKSLEQIAAFVFCDGPGSVLGIRTVAVALRTWCALTPRPVFSYSSLHLVATDQLRHRPGRAYTVIADARRDTWHRVCVDQAGTVGALERVAASQLRGELVTPEHFRTWAPLPADVTRVPYVVPELLNVDSVSAAPLFRTCSEPDAFLHEDPVYKTWTPQVHRAPT